VVAQVFITGSTGVYEYAGCPRVVKGITLWRAEVACSWELHTDIKHPAKFIGCFGFSVENNNNTALI